MPGAVPFTSTTALTNATLPYVIKLANNGWEKACREDESLLKGLSIVEGELIYKKVADLFNLPLETLN